MLVLTRRVGESILIGDDIQIKVSEVDRGLVKLAVKAPDDVPIVRQEISQRVGGKIVAPKRNPNY